VAGDYLQLAQRLAQHLGAAGGHIAVGGAVKAVAAYAVVLVILIGQGVHKGLAGHCLMEGGIEHGHHGYVAHDFFAGLDAGDVGGVVQGGEGDALAHCRHDGVVYAHGGGKFLAAVDQTMADCVYFLHGGHHTVFGAGELVDDCGNGLGVSGHGHVLIELGLAAHKGSVLQMAVDAYALAQTLGQNFLRFHVDELILEGRTACVDNKYLHFFCCSFLDIVNSS